MNKYILEIKEHIENKGVEIAQQSAFDGFNELFAEGQFEDLASAIAIVIDNKINIKDCKSCKFFNIKSDEHGICDNPKNEFPLRFNASNKGYDMLKPEVKLSDFEAEIKPYTTFYIHQDFGCVNHCL